MTTPVRELVKPLVGETARRAYATCVYCGGHCYGRTCQAHRDLPQLELEHQLSRPHSNEAAASLDPGSATASQLKGA